MFCHNKPLFRARSGGLGALRIRSIGLVFIAIRE